MWAAVGSFFVFFMFTISSFDNKGVFNSSCANQVDCV